MQNTSLVQRRDQRLQVVQREIRLRRLNSSDVIFRDVQRTLGPVVAHVQRATIYSEIRAELSHRSLVNLMTIERATNGLRNAMRHRLALCLLREEGLALTQNLFGVFALSEIARDSLHANRFAVTEDQPCADFETNTTSIFSDDVDLVNSRYFLAGFVSDHFAREI